MDTSPVDLTIIYFRVLVAAGFSGGVSFRLFSADTYTTTRARKAISVTIDPVANITRLQKLTSRTSRRRMRTVKEIKLHLSRNLSEF